MLYFLPVLNSMEHPQLLRFASRADRKRFDHLVKTYFDESGAGNGYSAYWPIWQLDKSEPLLQRVYIMCSFVLRVLWSLVRYRHQDIITSELDTELIRHMVLSLLKVRMNYDQIDVETPRSGWWGAMFYCSDLPKIELPQPGDMYRIPRRHLRESSFAYSEGRVLEIDAYGLATVLSCQDEDRNGSPNPGVKLYQHNVSEMIKIEDWLEDMYYYDRHPLDIQRA